MENVWSSQRRIFLSSLKMHFLFFDRPLNRIQLSTALLSRQRIVKIAPQITSFSMMCNKASHDKAVQQLKCKHVQDKGRNNSANPDTARRLFDRRQDPLMSSIIVNKAVLLFLYFSTVQ
jgi:hypothetical protein